MSILIFGLITGVLFGFLLQRGQVLRYDKQIGALRFQDMTILKFMLSHIVVAVIGIYFLADIGMLKFSIKPMIVGGVVLGGLIFGLGWGLLGYCPGTSVGALGEGRMDAFWGIVGSLLGAGLFAEAYPVLAKSVLTWGNYGKITLPQVLGINHWFVVMPFVVLIILFFQWLEKKNL